MSKPIQKTLVEDAAFPVLYSGKVIPGTYKIEVQVTRYAPPKNGMVTATFLRREVLDDSVVVTENTPQVLTLE